jgi:hypothetical protein
MSNLATLITEISIIAGVITAAALIIKRLINGMRCLLRDRMLRIYYHCKDQKKIRQYELENFVMLYEAYRALKGNSFICEIYKTVTSWEVVS